MSPDRDPTTGRYVDDDDKPQTWNRAQRAAEILFRDREPDLTPEQRAESDQAFSDMLRAKAQKPHRRHQAGRD